MVYEIVGRGTVVLGKVLTGKISLGQITTVNGKTATVKSIEANHKQLAFAEEGLNAGIGLEGINKDDVKTGITLEFH